MMSTSIWNNDTSYNYDAWAFHLHVATDADAKSCVSSPKAKFVNCFDRGPPMA